MKTQYTPGPWDDNANGLILGNLNNYEGEAPFVADVCKSPLEYTEQEKANARLIAAAPALLDVLKELLSSADLYTRSVAERCQGKPSNEAINMLSAFSYKARKVLESAVIQ